MAYRATLDYIVAKVRLLISDTGVTPTFSDDEIADSLDESRLDHEYVSLSQTPTIQSGGVIKYLKYYAPSGGYWERDIVLQDF
jgi:hypothetical protein